jgi:peptidoglycan-associated lipoprotein
MKFSLIPVVLALALVACKSPVKLDSATVEDRQAAAAAAAEKSPTPILGNSLLKDAANSARNVAALDLSAKDANARAVGSAGVSGQAAADAANAAAAAKLAAAAGTDAPGSTAAKSAAAIAASSTSARSAAAAAAASPSAAAAAASPSAAAAAASSSAAAAAASSSAAAAAASSSAAALAMRERIVYFDFDSFVIRAEARPVIEAHGRRLRADDKLRVALEGHTDDRGGREYNLGLGQKRADAVRKALSLMGVTDGQMEAVSFGKEKPAVPGNTEAAMQENRRVEINYR